MSSYYTTYKDIFDRVKVDVQAITDIKQVVTGEPFRLQDLPCAIINPEPARFEKAVVGPYFHNYVDFSAILIVRETEPENWFTDVINPLGQIVDRILADRTLNGKVKDVAPTFFSPGEIRFENRLYYGGVARFTAYLIY